LKPRRMTAQDLNLVVGDTERFVTPGFLCIDEKKFEQLGGPSSLIEVASHFKTRWGLAVPWGNINAKAKEL
ncbi:MAG: hypothetical protein V3V20_12555, partial [Algisphaera sp.]